MFKLLFLLFIATSYSMSPPRSPALLVECSPDVDNCEGYPDRFSAEISINNGPWIYPVEINYLEENYTLDDYLVYVVDSNNIAIPIGKFISLSDSVLISNNGSYRLIEFEYIKLTRVKNRWKDYLKKGIFSGMLGMLVGVENGWEGMLIGGLIGYVSGNVVQNHVIKQPRHEYLYLSKYRE